MGNPTPPPSTQIATIPDLPLAGALNGAELIWINQAGLDRSAAVSAVAALGGAGVYLPLTGGNLSGSLSVSGSLTVGGSASGTTPNAGDNSAAFATTAFVQNAIAGVAGVSSFNGRNGAVSLTQADVTGVGGATAAQLANYLPLAGGAISGALSVGGGLTATTPAPGNSSTTVATTAFVANALPLASSTTPPMDGVAAVGTGTTWARADHVHPTDTSRAPLNSPTFTGTVTIPAGASIAGYLPLTGGTLTGSLTVNSTTAITAAPSSGDASIWLRKPAATNWNMIWGQTGTSARWMLGLGTNEAETGSNAGSNFVLQRYGDNGSVIDTPLAINRSTGATTLGGSLTVSSSGGISTTGGMTAIGYGARTGLNGSYTGNSFNISFAAPYADLWIDLTNQGHIAYQTASDRRLKSNIKPSGDALAIVSGVSVYDLDIDLKEIGKKTEHWPFSLIADEVADLIPHAALEYDGHWISLNPTHLCAVLWKAVQELAAEVEALKAQHA